MPAGPREVRRDARLEAPLRSEALRGIPAGLIPSWRGQNERQDDRHTARRGSPEPVFLLVPFVFWSRGPWAGDVRWPDPQAILAARYARGEITDEEYRERLGHASGPDHAADRFGVLFFKPGRRSPRRRR